jgi:hypothetical protein
VVRTRGATGVEADTRSALCDTRSEKRGPSAAASANAHAHCAGEDDEYEYEEYEYEY